MKTLEERINSFIERCKEVHKDKNYDYSMVPETYVNNRTNVCIIDRDLKPDGTEYGPFYATPSNLLKGKGNGARRGERIRKTKAMTAEEYFTRVKEIHKDENLDYSKAVYKGLHEKILIVDHDKRPDGTEYGEYWQEANSHMRGCVHPRKALDRRTIEMSSTTEYFINKCTEVHKGKYTYEKTNYVNNRTRVIVTCPTHGDFLIMAGNHMRGKGCPMCGNHLSIAEDEIKKHLRKYLGNDDVIERDRNVLGNLELDIYIPSRKVGIEYDGIKWHTEEYGKGKDYHYGKMNGCNDNGVRLIHIFEDDYLNKKEIVYNRLNKILSIDTGLPTINSDNCTINEIDCDVAGIFLEENSINGGCKTDINIACFYNEEIVGVLCLEMNFDQFTIKRLTTAIKYNCQGIEDKLFSWFMKEYQPNAVRATEDRRWYNTYEQSIYYDLGLEFDGYTYPDYTYSCGRGVRQDKSNFSKEKLITEEGFSSEMTEDEMAKELGYWRIWDCGLIKYLWKKR